VIKLSLPVLAEHQRDVKNILPFVLRGAGLPATVPCVAGSNPVVAQNTPFTVGRCLYKVTVM